MTIRFLRFWNGNPEGSIATLSAVEESRLIGLGIATSNLNAIQSGPNFDSMADFNAAGGASGMGDGTYNIGGSMYTVKDGGLYNPNRLTTPKGRAFGGNYGRRVNIWASALSGSAGTVALVAGQMPPQDEGQTQFLRITQNSTPSYGQRITDTADYIPTSRITTSCGFWANNPTNKHLGLSIIFFNVAANKQLNYTCSVKPTNGWEFFTCSGFAIVGSTPWTFGTDAIHIVRAGQNDTWGAWSAGDYVDVGAIYTETKGRPRFLICNDDGTYTINRHFAATDVTPASGRSFRQIVEHYGFKGTLYIVPSLINTNGYLTKNELLDLYNSGWAIGSHSWTHPAYSNRGLTSLGPVGFADVNDPYHNVATNDDTAIYNDVYKGIVELGKLGIPNPDRLFAIPQGTYDDYVRSAVIRCGIKHVRGVGSYNDIKTLSIGNPTGLDAQSGTKNQSGWIHQYESIQTDGATTDVQVKSYIDDLITIGGTGANYHHGLISANAVVLDSVLSYLKTKSDAGLISVMTAEQAAFDDGLF